MAGYESARTLARLTNVGFPNHRKFPSDRGQFADSGRATESRRKKKGDSEGFGDAERQGHRRHRFQEKTSPPRLAQIDPDKMIAARKGGRVALEIARARRRRRVRCNKAVRSAHTLLNPVTAGALGGVLRCCGETFSPRT